MGPLVDPFLDNEFMLRALVAGCLVALACAVVGTFVVLRGLAFIGDALRTACCRASPARSCSACPASGARSSVRA